jgi:peptidase M28-like protein
VRQTFRVLSFLMLPGLLAGQSPASVQRAVQSITPDDIRRRIGIIADDSMRGRDTPSPELEKVAAYIASEFRRLGLKPGGDNGTFLQRYAIDRVQFVAESSIAIVHGGGDATLAYGRDFVFSDNMFENGDYAGDLVLLTGAVGTVTQLDTAALAGKMLVVTARVRSRAERQRLFGWRPAGLIILTSAPDSVWATVVDRSAQTQLRDPSRRVGPPLVLTVRSRSLAPVLARLGADSTAVQQAAQAGAPLAAQPLGGGLLHVHARIRAVDRKSAPNVVGILEGSDPRLKSEYVILSAHMDHVGVGRPVNGDSIYNGADDDASGTTAVVEAAEAFAQLQPRPKRSIIFLTVSGEEKGLWGSAYFADHPPVPVGDIVADLNSDMVGRNWKDTIVVIGKEHSDLGATLNRVGAAHPELNMQPIDDIWPQENFYSRSDHYNFARKGVPILFFFNGTHADYHRPSDSVDKIDAEKESRIVKLVFYLGLDVANAANRPKWNPDSYAHIVTGN